MTGDGGPRGFARPRKRFGQHFLADRRILGKIADALGANEASRVLEIGPGRGALTDLLAVRAGTLTVIEIDRELAAFLRARYAGNARVRVIEGDALDVAWPAVAGGPYLLTGNLPYNLTTPLLFKALDPPLPERAVFLVQREVASRLVAREGGRSYGALTVNVQITMTPEIIAQVPAGAFHPRPAVDSTVVRLTPRPQQALPVEALRAFRRFVQGMFGMRRKQLARGLREAEHLSAGQATALLDRAGLAHDVRPETLTPEQFVSLFSERQRSAGPGAA